MKTSNGSLSMTPYVWKLTVDSMIIHPIALGHQIGEFHLLFTQNTTSEAHTGLFICLSGSRTQPAGVRGQAPRL